MKITAIETIPVSVPVGRFRDGMDKVAGHDAPPRYHLTFTHILDGVSSSTMNCDRVKWRRWRENG